MPSLADLLSAYPALSPHADAIERLRVLLTGTFQAGGRLLLCGNGGSAACCDHVTGELQKGFLSRRPLPDGVRRSLLDGRRPDGAPLPDGRRLADALQGGCPAVSLPSQTAVLTAVCNDMDPALLFAQSVLALGAPGDLLLCLSTSGNSENVVLAAETALGLGLSVAALTGERASRLSDLAHVTVRAPSAETYRAQEYHLAVCHYLCAAAERALFADGAPRGGGHVG